MTVQISPAAELNLENDKTTAESIEARISSINELIDNTLIIYENQQIRIEEMDKPATKLADLSNGPWSGAAFGAEEVRVIEGVARPVTNNRLSTNSVWDFMFTSPIKDVYYVPPNLPDAVAPIATSTLTNPVPNILRGRYDTIFREHIERINFSGGIKDNINNAVAQLNNLNTVGYQTSLEKTKEIIVEPLLSELVVLSDIISAVELEINNPQSVMYKPGSSFGPYSTEVISLFQLPPLMLQIKQGIAALLPLLKEIYNRLDNLVNIPQDVLTRISLLNAGLEQSAEDPSQFNLITPQEKDPWGIRFTYNAQQAANLYAQQNQVNEYASRAGSNGIGKRNATERAQELKASRDLLAENTFNLKKDFYFQLLPAIKSNLPVSGGTDVPGAMPGIQFRIENNIVKHKIPGFAPVYQPIGIDCIKCTLVGMFTGSDGVDLSGNYLEDLSAGLLSRGQSLLDLPFVDRSNYTLAKGGPKLSEFSARNNSFSRIDPRNNPSIMKDGVDLPIPSQSRSSTASPVAIMTEDAFRGAQDFYNEIVAQGREVEVELNLRKGTGPEIGTDFTGGGVGPFRDPETGNPKFKALIKRVDLYYTRRDRCWFIIDLEITDSGLIGKDCLNLTNIIEESIDLFEGVTEPLGLTKEQLDDCFTDPIEIELKGDRTGQAFVIDKTTGYSYYYNIASGNLLSDRTYPLNLDGTLSYLNSQIRGSEVGRLTGFGLDVGTNRTRASKEVLIISLMTLLVSEFEPQLTGKENDLANSWMPHQGATASFHGTAWRYDKNLGKFIYVYDKNGDIIRDPGVAQRRAKTLKELIQEDKINYSDGGAVDKIASFIVSEYSPLLKKPTENLCDDILDEVQKSNFNKQDQATNKAKAGTKLPDSIVEQVISIQGDGPQLESLQQVDIVDNVENENYVPQEVKEGIENGSLDRLIEQALNEYIKVMAIESLSFFGTALTPDLMAALKRLVKKGSLYTTNAFKGVNIKVRPNSVKVNDKDSNTSEITVNVRFTFDKPFLMSFNNRTYKFEPELASTIPRDAQVNVKAFLQNGIKVYKIDGIIINTELVPSERGQASRVPNANNNIQPSDNNQPSTVQPNIIQPGDFVGPSVDSTTQI